MKLCLRNFCFCFFSAITTIGGYAQGLDLTNVFRPRFEVYTDGSDNTGSSTAPLRLNASQRVGVGVFVPLKSKTSANIDFGKLLSSDANKAVTPRVYQVFGSLRVEYAQHNIVSDTMPGVTESLNSQRFSAGITGIHVRKKLSLLFYSVSITQNSETSFPKFDPQVIGLIGKLKPKSLKLAWIYGAVAGRQSQGKAFLLPFGGVSVRVFPKLSANIIFPAQIKLRYRFNRKSYLDAGSWVNGERILMNPSHALSDKHDVLRYVSLRHGLQWQYKVSRAFRTYLAAGVEAPARMTIVNIPGTYTATRFFVRASVQFNIGSGLVDSGKLDFGL